MHLRAQILFDGENLRHDNATIYSGIRDLLHRLALCHHHRVRVCNQSCRIPTLLNRGGSWFLWVYMAWPSPVPDRRSPRSPQAAQNPALISCTPRSPKKRKEEGRRAHQGNNKGINILKGGPSPLPPPPLGPPPPLLFPLHWVRLLHSSSPSQCPQGNKFADPCVPKEGQRRWCLPLIPKERPYPRGPRELPPAGLPNTLPQRPNMGAHRPRI